MTRKVSLFLQILLVSIAFNYILEVPIVYSQDTKTLKIKSVSSNIDTVTPGQQNLSIQMQIENKDKKKSIVITRSNLTFMNNSVDISNHFIVSPHPQNPNIIDKRSKTELNFEVSVSEMVPTGVITLDGEIEGKSFWPDKEYLYVGADKTDEWFVAKLVSISISSIQVSQSYVTQLQEKDWDIWMEVQNLGDATMRFDSAKISINMDMDVTHEYEIINPTSFWNNGIGSQIITAKNKDQLRFTIDKTGNSSGIAKVQGTLWTTDVITNQQYIDQNVVSSDSFTVQTPANLSLESVICSQDSIAVGQEQDWMVEVGLKNLGESSIYIDTSKIHSYLTFEIDGNIIEDFELIQPIGLNSQPDQFELLGGQDAKLTFIIDKTTNTSGLCTITAIIGGYEINSDRELSEELMNQVVIVPSSSISILSTTNRAINQPYVNTNQLFNVDVIFFNGSDEGINDVRIDLNSDGSSSFSSPVSVSSIAPGISDTATFQITASNSVDSLETFTAKILSATLENSGQPVSIFPSIDSTANAVIERPAGLKISSIFPSSNEVEAGQSSPYVWQIYIVVEDTGGASLTFKNPNENDIVFSNNSVIQNDYIVIPPYALQSGDLRLSGAEVDTLVYTVYSTGEMEGDVEITTNIQAEDNNDLHNLFASDNCNIIVTPSGAIKILSTNLDVPNPPDVNLKQRFNLFTDIENLSPDAVENVYLSISSDGHSQIFNPVQYISYLSGDGSASVFFEIQADSIENLSGETFFVKIDSARSVINQLPVLIKPSDDDTELVKIEEPVKAQLELSIEGTDGFLSTDKICTVSADIINLGSSGLKDSGLVELIIPENYRFISGNNSNQVLRDTLFISKNISAEWQIETPAVPQGPDFLISKWIYPPKDENTDSSAIIVSIADSMAVTTVVPYEISSQTEIVAPSGAIDDTISTDQEFQIRTVSETEANLTDFVATLILPENYSSNESKTKNVENDTVFWTIQGPTISDQDTKKLIIELSAKDLSGTNYFFATDTIKIIALNKANLSLNASIVEPPDVQTGQLTIGQKFILRTDIINSGQAGTLDLIQIHLDLGSTGITVSEPLTRIFQFENNDSVTSSIDWNGTAPLFPTSDAHLTVNILTTPLDENSNKEAYVSQDFVRLKINTKETATLSKNIRIVAPVGARDNVLSSGQTFLIRATFHSNKCSNIQSQLILPEGSGFFTENSLKSISTGVDSVTWTVIAPNVPLQKSSLKFLITANDQTDNQKIIIQQDSIIVSVVEKAELQVSGTSSKSIVSTEEVFSITATINNFGKARCLNEALMQLSLPQGFSTTDDTIKSSSQFSVNWIVKAPNKTSVLPYKIYVSMIGRPIDENTNTLAAVNDTMSNISILVEEKQLELLKIESLGETTIAQGKKNVPVLGLSLRNKGNIGSNPILVDGIKFYVRGRNDELIPPQTIFSKISISNFADTTLDYGSISEIPSENPIHIPFSEILQLMPENSNTSIGFFADILPNAKTNSFYVAIENEFDIHAIDAITKHPVIFVDQAGNRILSNNITSNIFVILNTNLKTTFGNYPNPFGKTDRLKTKFVYYLDKNSNGEIKIYTLTGDLVWVYKFLSTDLEGSKGIHDGEITWDGKNGNGHSVLPGVYIAVFTSSNGDRNITKVAYIK